MEKIILDDKEITIRKLAASDLKNARKFANYINNLIEEDVYLTADKKYSLKQEAEFLKIQIEKIKKKNSVFLVAEKEKKVIGVASIERMSGKQGHIGLFGISIAREWRGLGLGTRLIGKIFDMAKKDFEPSIKMITLDVIADNKPAFSLYRKMGFEEVAVLPRYFQHKGGLLDIIVMNLYL
ncbi:MAG: GNAT family N-acetyltransferase [Minisyncoccales bacterium]|jgi:RimJ/RimL family protein N-acetyltransferase|nr:GNAT family N-acetyltransferase [Candidatus Pacearchaeota archaeon]